MDGILMKHKREPPYPKFGSIDVGVGMYLESLGGFRQTEMTFEVDIYLYMSWRDKTLSHPGDAWIINDDVHRKRIWVPDIYFANARKAELQDVTVPNFNLYVYSNGTIAYSLRTTLTVACALDLHNYPMDSQECKIDLLSYSHVEELVRLSWFKDPITRNDAIALPELRIIKIKPQVCNGFYHYSKTATGSRKGNFSCLSARIHLTRSLLHNLIQTYIPLGGIAIVSWTSFWIDRRATPARVTLTFMTLVSLTSMGNGMRFALPQVSYAKAIDYYYFACMLFVFGALIEFAFVNSYMRKSEKYEKLATKYKDQSDKKLLNSPIIFSAFQKSYDQMLKMRRRSNAAHALLENLRKRSKSPHFNRRQPGRNVKFSFTNNECPHSDSDSDCQQQNGETRYFPNNNGYPNGDINSSFYDNVHRVEIGKDPNPRQAKRLSIDEDPHNHRQSLSPHESSTSSEPISKPNVKDMKRASVAPNPQLSTEYQEFAHVLSRRALNIDKLSRILFPLTFTIFNVLYWTLYLV
uniref:Uncharacterized protein n=1 Tax=Panagrolaimus sp. JU765 TaxID=591449 RepID=A0AC34QIR2_9BILA